MYLADGQFTLAVGSLTSVYRLRNARHSTNHYSSMSTYFYWPANPTGAADYVRNVNDLTPASGLVDFNANLASATLSNSAVYLLFHGIHPQQFVDALLSAMRVCYFPTREPLSVKPISTTVADAGFQSSVTSSWTESDVDSGAATGFTKISTANSEDVFYGVGAGRILNTAAAGYIRQRYNVTGGDTVVITSLTRLAAGTNSELVAWDVTNDAQIGTTVEHAQESWQFMTATIQIPATCKIFEIRHRGEGTTDDVRINGSWVQPQSQRRFVLDTMWEATEWALPRLLAVKFGGQSVASNVYDAHSAELVAIEPGPHTYTVDADPAGAHEIAIQIHDTSLLRYPLYVNGRRALSDLTTFTPALSQTTPGDLDLLAYATMVEMFQDGGTASHVPGAPEIFAMAAAGFKGASAQQPFPKPATPVRQVAFMGLHP